MSAWSKILSPEERVEVEEGVVAAYIDAETGETRSTMAAKAEFIEFVRQAQRAGRTWADYMVEEWADAGAGNFAAALWKRRDAFTTTVSGEQRARSLYRGKKSMTDDGQRVDVQASLLTWTVDDLKAAISAERRRANESRINRDTYASLIRLCEETGTDRVDVALNAVGMSLDEYLAADDAASA